MDSLPTELQGEIYYMSGNVRAVNELCRDPYISKRSHFKWCQKMLEKKFVRYDAGNVKPDVEDGQLRNFLDYYVTNDNKWVRPYYEYIDLDRHLSITIGDLRTEMFILSFNDYAGQDENKYSTPTFEKTRVEEFYNFGAIKEVIEELKLNFST